LVAVAIVADDLTGAFDSAAPFADRGAETLVATSARALGAAGADAAVLAVSTASRHLSAEAAAHAVGEACRALAARSPRVWFKKIDSTLRGNVAAECVAALAASGRQELVITPATPAQGRVVRRGIVLVHGTPLAETEYVRDAVSPASPAALADQLRTADPGLAVAVVDGTPDGGADGRRAWVADADSDEALSRIAAWALAHADRVLMAGAAGFGTALAAALFGAAAARPGVGALDGPIVYVVGSRASASRRQAERLAGADCVCLDAPCGRLDAADAAARIAGRRAALVRVPDGARDAADPDAVARALGAGVAALLARARVGALLVTGGDVTAAVLAAIDQPLVRVVGEVAPGIPLSRVEVGGRPLWLVTKAGGFGGDDLFADLPRLLGG